jgi:hypothetical protein
MEVSAILLIEEEQVAQKNNETKKNRVTKCKANYLVVIDNRSFSAWPGCAISPSIIFMLSFHLRCHFLCYSGTYLFGLETKD